MPTCSPVIHRLSVLLMLWAESAHLIEDRPDVAQRRHCINPRRPLATLPYPLRQRHQLNDLGHCLTAERTADDRALWALERAADAFLRSAGDTVVKLDVADRDTRLPIVAPDRVSFRGVARYRRSAPMRYGAKVRVRWMGTPWAPIKITLHETTVIGRGVRLLGCTGQSVGWQGVRTLIDSKGHKARKARTAVKRKTATGTRGVARTAWSLSERSLPRAWSKADLGQLAMASDLEQIIRTSERDTDVRVSCDLTFTHDGAMAALVTEHGPSAQYGIRAFARRAALARLAID